MKAAGTLAGEYVAEIQPRPLSTQSDGRMSRGKHTHGDQDRYQPPSHAVQCTGRSQTEGNRRSGPHVALARNRS